MSYRGLVREQTPDHGINFSTRAELKLPIDDDVSEKPLSWYRTMFDISRIPVRQWAEICDDWGVTTLGCLDVSIRAVSCSPSGLSTRGRCVLAALSVHEVTLWEATKNHLKGEWTMIVNVTDHIVEMLDRSDKSEILKAQTSTWSSQPDFGVLPAPLVDASILALGSRGGTVSLHRLCLCESGQGSTASIARVELSEQWITHLAWSLWVTLEINQSCATLAYGMANGSVGILEVTQTLETPPIKGFVPEYNQKDHLHVNVKSSQVFAFGPDKRGITGLRWVGTPVRSSILVVTKPGIVHLWSLPSSSPVFWHGSKTLQMELQRSSAGSSSLATVSGLSYVTQRDVLIISLSDGSLHAIHNISIDPSWVPLDQPMDSTSLITSKALTEASRAFFVRSSQDAGVDYTDVNQINGLVPYDSYSTLVWIYE
ncbi:hypothetical protein ID866_8123 [Astraeus odoratus]|nr:hypothetical protein ID866_8123 [Astraeus odoratus]